MKKTRNANKTVVGNPTERTHLGELDVDDMTISNRILK